jgi:transmembrane secretion effector
VLRLLGDHLRGNRDFARMWASLSVSELGDRFTTLALPTVAILTLHAGATTVGLLAMFGTLPELVFSMVGGVIADRGPRRRILVGCDLLNACVVGSVPLAGAFGALSIAQLYVVAFVEGVAGLLSFLTFYAVLPGVAGRAGFADANARLEASRQATRVAGPGLAGLLIQAVGAARAITVDAASFVFSALLLSGLRGSEAVSEAGPRPGFRRDFADGARLVFGDPPLRRLALCSSIANFGAGMGTAVSLLFLYTQAGMTAGQVGAISTAVAVVAPAITFNTPAIAARLGMGRTLILSATGYGLAWCVLPLATHAPAGAIVALSFGLVSLSGAVWNVSMISLRQAFTPDGMFGRMVATTKTIATGSTPIGALVGGVLGTTLGLPVTLVIAGLTGLGAVAVLLDRDLLSAQPSPA